MTKLPDVFSRAHAHFKNHDDGKGRCRVCGGPIDMDRYFAERDEAEMRQEAEAWEQL